MCVSCTVIAKAVRSCKALVIIEWHLHSNFGKALKWQHVASANLSLQIAT